MICKNCGAEIDDTLLLCPYCNTENEAMALKEHKGEISLILEQAEEFKTRPERIAKKVNYKVSRIAFFATAGFLVLLLVVFAASRLVGDRSVTRMEKKLAKLERYYAAGDYEGMGDYLDKLDDTYGERYKKYKNVWGLYHWLDSQEGSYDYVKEYIDTEYMKAEDLVSVLERSQDLLFQIWEAEEAGFRYDESEGMLYIRNEIWRMMKEATGITDEEIVAYFGDFSDVLDELPDLTELAELLLAR
ncbi:MAG: hypothetical protein IJZ55_04385 [Lachnospiraceae bacterium]|nr:hypothetical protein [Lachnospiraceae bacterium]